MKLFYAKFGCGEKKGIDVFTVSWGVGLGYFHLPAGLIWKVVRKAERMRARGVLLVPDWLGSVY